MSVSSAIIWLLIAVALIVIEGATVQFVFLWFAAGAVVSMLASLMGAPVSVQLVLFIITSIVALLTGRPILQKKITPKKTATNADAVIGKNGVVTEEINNLMQTGRVIANGLDWTARSADDSKIEVKQKVAVKAIDGVKLIVERTGED
ncbi:MAG: NfeD family protein [Oscillospiraceae bacterium]|nr:NfeD family protein [Oscillospiraceae bacterium]